VRRRRRGGVGAVGLRGAHRRDLAQRVRDQLRVPHGAVGVAEVRDGGRVAEQRADGRAHAR